MNDGIYLRVGGGMHVLRQERYADEATLQQLLESHPELIAGVATGNAQPRLLLVKREAGIASASPGSSYSLDHLYVDSDGVPVFVEVKLSTDTRIRREVVGQLLDYVALGIPDWPADRIRKAVKSLHPGADEAEVLNTQLGWAEDPDKFWNRVQDNLEGRRVRMVFVADHLPPDLVRVIVFLNEQMRDVDVLGVEVPLYSSHDTAAEAFVPMVKGDTPTARRTKEVWTRAAFLEEAKRRALSTHELDLMERLLAHAEGFGDPHYGKADTPGVNAWYRIGAIERPVWYLTTSTGAGSAYMYFYLPEIQKHAGEPRLQAFAETLRSITPLKKGVDEAEAKGWNKWPSASLSALSKTSLDNIFAAVAALSDT